MPDRSPPIEVNLTAAILAISGEHPVVFAAPWGPESLLGLPTGPFDPRTHRTLELGLRHFVESQAKLALGYVEQLYTFGDRGRQPLAPGGAPGAAEEPHVLSIGYLALTKPAPQITARAEFAALYRFLPWEDWRGGEPAVLRSRIRPELARWRDSAPDPDPARERTGLARGERIDRAFGTPELPFDEEKVLERYELLYEAGLVEEAARDGRVPMETIEPGMGAAMPFDHRRILATALGRLRAKIKYRPVVFELLSPVFTLTELQRKVEAISGHHLHKQNFRRLVETGGLVEPTGEQTTTRGRPAALFRFRRDVLAERPAPGLRVGRSG